MATPPYQGTSQPLTDNGGGLLGRLGSFFGGGGTPSYSGIGQPSSSTGALSGSGPAYAPAPIAVPTEDAAVDAYDSIVCSLDPAALAAGQIAIVIPRERLGPIEKT